MSHRLLSITSQNSGPWFRFRFFLMMPSYTRTPTALAIRVWKELREIPGGILGGILYLNCNTLQLEVQVSVRINISLLIILRVPVQNNSIIQQVTLWCYGNKKSFPSTPWCIATVLPNLLSHSSSDCWCRMLQFSSALHFVYLSRLAQNWNYDIC